MPATPDGGDGTSSSSSGSSGASSSGDGTSSSSSSGSNGDPDASTLVPVGDGSIGAACNKDDECNAKICGAGNKCVSAKSCRPSNGKAPGIDTCGAAEPGDDSCCKSLTLPKTKTRTLDRYEITAGRIRVFIEALKADHGGNLRKFASDFAKANPTSQLGKLATDFPGYLDVMPTDDKVTSEAPLPIWLGAFPQDAINVFDGCYLSPDGYGAATYWQDPSVLKEYGIGYTDPGNGIRKFSKDVLDTKPANCMAPVMLATFCAWDGGELARTSDYREVYGTQEATIGAGTKILHPWTALLKPGEFNWRNGHGAACPAGWPGCAGEPTPVFFSFPKGGNPGDDDSAEIGAPGRFPKDVTKAVSEDGGGWFDIGGNLLEAMWPNTTAVVPAVKDFCDTTAGLGAGAAACNRNVAATATYPAEARPGTVRFKGNTPAVFLEGYSFEGHAGYSAKYLGAATDDEAANLKATAFVAHFQYGKVGGRCVRVKK